MPRRNNRERYEPLDLTVEPRILRESAPKPRYGPANLTAHAARHQLACRSQRGIDWNICLVPGCGRDSLSRPVVDRDASAPATRRDPELDVALCFQHALTVFDRMAKHASDPAVIHALADLQELKEQRIQAEREAAKAARLARRDGEIYFVQIGDLIKVGWTRDLFPRLKHYGASAVLLAHYPATRDDETYLHRNLKPARAKGREWYHDAPAVRRYINEAVEKYGPPEDTSGLWTVPREKTS
jgi:hypothetical protein